MCGSKVTRQVRTLSQLEVSMECPGIFLPHAMLARRTDKPPAPPQH